MLPGDSRVVAKLPETKRNAVSAPAVADKHESSAETGIDNFLHLMRHELVAPLRQVAELAERMEEMRAAGYAPGTLSGQTVFQQLVEASRRSAIIANRLINLGEILAGPPLLADERIMLAYSLHRAASGLGEAARTRGVGLRFDDSSEDLAPIYGSTYWLEVALRGLLDLLIESAQSGTHIQLRLRQVGCHQLLSASLGQSRPSGKQIDLLKEMPITSKTAIASAHRLMTLDLVLVKAIVEIHGGMLRCDSAEDGAVSGFQLTLPTGEPYAKRRQAECERCPYTLQIEYFARDIGELLKGKAPAQTEYSIYDKRGRI